MAAVLILGPPSERLLAAVEKATGATVLSATGADDDALPSLIDKHGGDIAVVGAVGEAVDATLMDRLPKLGLIANFGVGYDGIDVEAATQRRIVVTNTPGILGEDVADMAVLLLLATVRGLLHDDRLVREGRWPDEPQPTLRPAVHRMTVGIVGLGDIGSAIARRLQAFGCTILYHTRSRKDVGYTYFGDVKEMAAAADALILIVPGGDETRHMIDADVLKALGERGFLVNVARGSVVDEEALIAALENGTIAGAGLDVFADEPNVPQALRNSDRVVLTPHSASGTFFAHRALAELFIGNIRDFLGNGTVKTPVPECRDDARTTEQ